jgi:hypothetical protein
MRVQLTWLTAGILTLTCGAQVFAAPVVVACGPGQRAVVRNTFVRGDAFTRVECVRGSAYRSVVYRESRVRRYRAERRHRSWGKSALMIGGSAATGAGIGGIVHGKKGALIGTALGAGAASIYEGAHRR